MTPRFRMIAGPNGSGKTTLCGRLSSEFAVNLYAMVNADDLFAAAVRDRIVLAPLPVDRADLDRQIAPALPFLSRAFFFDNSGTEMIHLASCEEGGKWTLAVPESSLPNWFRKFVPAPQLQQQV